MSTLDTSRVYSYFGGFIEPTARAPHFGVVSAAHVLYIEHRSYPSSATRRVRSSLDPTFFLNTDMWDL